MARRMNLNKRIAKRETPYNLVRLHNHLVYNSSYYLSPLATKILYYIIAKRFAPDTVSDNLNDEEFYPLKELSRAIVQIDKEMDVEVSLSTRKSSNSLYDTVEAVIKELSQLQFIFPSDLYIGDKPLPTIINVFNSVGGGHGNNKEQGIIAQFNPNVNMLLYQLQRYVLVYRTEINKLTSGYTIKFYQMLRGVINRKKKFGVIYCKEVLSLEETHFLLNTSELETYKAFKHFNQLILKKIIKDLLKHTSIHLEITPIRTYPPIESPKAEGEKPKRGRKRVSHLELKFHDTELVKNASSKIGYGNDYVPSDEDIDQLTFAELRAYEALLDFKVKEGIAFRQIIPSITGSESIGFEDFFIEETINYFKQYSKNQSTEKLAVSTYVSWWTKHKYFDVGTDAWTPINEQVMKRKEELRKTNARAFVNRTIAKDMTAKEFTNQYRNTQQIAESKNNDTPANPPVKGFQSFGDLVNKLDAK